MSQVREWPSRDDADEPVEALAQWLDLQRRTLDNMPIAVCVLSPVHDGDGLVTDFRVDYANPVACEHEGRDLVGALASEQIDVFVQFGRDAFAEFWIERRPVSGVVDLLDRPRHTYEEVAVRRVGDRLLVTTLDRTEEMLALRAAEAAETNGRLIVESLAQPVFVYVPVLDGDRVVDLVLTDANRAGYLQAMWECSPGVRASEHFVLPELAYEAATQAWRGLPVERYEITKELDTVEGGIVYEVTTTRVGDRIMQVVFDRTFERSVAIAEERFRLIADLLAQPMHLHRPILDEHGVLVDTEIVFANRVAEEFDPYGEGHVGQLSSEVLYDPTGQGLVLYRDAWHDSDGAMHTFTFDNLDSHLSNRPAVFLEVQARRVGDRLLTVALDRTEAELVTRQATAVRDQLAAMFDSLSEGVVVLGPEGEFLAANASAAAMVGVASPTELLGRHIDDLDYQVYTADGALLSDDDLQRLTAEGGSLDDTIGLLRRVDGSEVRLVFSTREFRLPDGSQGTLLTASDVSDLHEAFAQTARAEQQFRTSVQALGDPLLLVEGDGSDTVLVQANRAASVLGGDRIVAAAGERVLDLALHPAVAAVLCGPAVEFAEINLAGDPAQTFEVSVVEAGSRRVAVFRDVSRVRAEAALLEHLATHDAVSGLPNRRGLDQHLASVVGAFGMGRHSAAVIVVEVDQVEAIQRSFGFTVADGVMAEVLARLLAAVHPPAVPPSAVPPPAVHPPVHLSSAFVAQLTGNSYAVVIDTTDRAATLSFAEGLVHSLARPVRVDGVGLHVEASAGVAFAPLHGRDSETLVMRAKSAAWTAQRTRVPAFTWQPEVDRDRIDRVELLADVDKALSNDELFVEFQPKLEFATNRVVGAEALVRWMHPGMGPLAPSQFIAEVEGSALAVRFTAWVLHRSLVEWVSISPPAGTRLAVNLPPALAGDPGLVPMVEAALIASGAAPEMLEFEITERGLLTPSNVLFANMAALRTLGVNFVIDDFGTGQASLLYLRRLPVQAVKIDRAFVHHLESDVVNRSIVAACVGVAAALHIDVIAEGLENHSEVAAAIGLGCGFGQGFRISRPLSIGAFAAAFGPEGTLHWR